jgi:hypothetical protein
MNKDKFYKHYKNKKINVFYLYVVVLFGVLIIMERNLIISRSLLKLKCKRGQP